MTHCGLPNSFDFPDFDVPYECVLARHADEYPMNEDRVVSSGAGLDAWRDDLIQRKASLDGQQSA